ncbi:MAG: diguanylate cyclase [Bacteroidetes bacterium]|nr:diguanylate cyclase [Bacteroidota bacterium]
MNTSSIGIGAVMLAAAAVFIYFDDPVSIRIISAVIFVFGAVLLYQTLSRSSALQEDEETQDTAAESSGAERSDAAVPPAQSRSVPHPPVTAPPDEIPADLYRFDTESLPQDDPRAEFDFLTNKLLQVLKEHVLAHTVGLFWINMDREQIIIGEFCTDSVNFTTARRLSLGSDLISRIALDAKPEIVSDISAASESDLVIFYDAAEGVKSFVGVPMFFGGDVIAVLAADSKAHDAFGLETVASLGRVTSLINLLLGSYNQKFDLAADSRMLSVLDRMQEGIDRNLDSYGVATVTAQAVSEIMDWDYVAVILHSPERKSWVIVKSLAKAANLPYVTEGVTVDMSGSVLKAALDNAAGIILDAPAPPAYRFHEKEAINSFGQLCVVPLVSSRAYYGLLVVEYRENHQYAEQDLAILRRIAVRSATAIENARYYEKTRKHLLLDETTQTASRTLLLRRLHEEQERIKARGDSAVFFLVRLDSPEELQQKRGAYEIEEILFNIGKTLQEHVSAYDIVGRYDDVSFGVLLLYSSPEDAYLRGEKIRKAVSGNVLSHAGSSYSISISIAGCTLSQSSDVDHILKLAQQAMDRAISDGGNCVKVV